MNSTDGLYNMLSKAIIPMVILAAILFIVLIVLIIRSSKKNKEEEKEIIGDKNKIKNSKNNKTVIKMPEYNKQSIFDFMEFDGIEDNMIVQRNGKRYVMAIECQGVNYDLMSQIEKVSVEEGFQQFLNTLRHPIQIYIQTRTINLGKSIATYKDRVREIERQYNQRVYEYNIMLQSGTYTKEQMDKAFYELTKQRNLYEYAKDIVDNTEKMSLNRNILNKKYYIIISYMPEEGATGTYNKEELGNMAFSELYTKAQALIRTLSACSVSGKILNSYELVDLLYVAYNRDDSEIFGLDKASQAEYEDLYSTSQDVFEKKIKVLDEKMQEDAVELANKAVENARNKSAAQTIAENKEESMDDLINQMAQILIEENKQYIGKNVAERAIEDIKKEGKEKKEGGKLDEKEKATTRGRKKEVK